MPETNSAILEAKRHAVDYWDSDGLPALVGGFSAVLFGVFWLVILGRFRLSWGEVLLSFVPMVLLKSVLEDKGFVEWLKGRITYPRTGYVAPSAGDESDPYPAISIIKEPPVVVRPSRNAIGISEIPFVVPAAFWFVGIFRSSWVGCVLAGAMASFSFWRNTKEDPTWVEIAGSVIAGLVGAISPVSGARRVGIVILVIGATSMARGATLLMLYLRQHSARQA
jgi:hypothetical protein